MSALEVTAECTRCKAVQMVQVLGPVTINALRPIAAKKFHMRGWKNRRDEWFCPECRGVEP